MRLEFPLHASNLHLRSHNSNSGGVSNSDKTHTEEDRSYHNNQEMMHVPVPVPSSASCSLMGATPPPLYEAALVGNWNELLQRLSSHPSEVSYSDKCKNTALHLACRRQPPPLVVSALIQAEAYLNHGAGVGAGVEVEVEDHTHSNGNSNNGNGNGNGNPKVLQRRTVDGLTALHFACYCGASPVVVDLLLNTTQAGRAKRGTRQGPKTPQSLKADYIYR